jgi:hypothetical protein
MVNIWVRVRFLFKAKTRGRSIDSAGMSAMCLAINSISVRISFILMLRVRVELG